MLIMKLAMFIIAPSHYNACQGIDLAKKIESSVSLLGWSMHILRKPSIAKNCSLMNLKISLENTFKVFTLIRICAYIFNREEQKEIMQKTKIRCECLF